MYRLKMFRQDVVAVVDQFLGRPHNKTRRQVQAAKAQFDLQTLQEQRIAFVEAQKGLSRDAALQMLESLEIENADVEGMPSTMSIRDRTTLALLIKIFQPEFVVETGVSSGSTSVIILGDMMQRQAGVLHSLDVETPFAGRYGELIPQEFRSRWHFHMQKKNEVLLPKLLRELQQIDFFLHDSLHTVHHMYWEYETAWPYLVSGGVLASHDVLTSTAFDDFGQAYREEITDGRIIGNFGFWIKA